MEPKARSNISSEDLKRLEAQLGREPRSVLEISKRCPVGHPIGHPAVIKVHPLVDGEPFPTLYWLSCPELVKQISRLEHEGYIEKLEALIAADETMRERYFQNHRDYIEERWKVFSEEDKADIRSQGYEKLFSENGIGGIRNWETIKCLHLQYAHHLARENVIGRWIDEHFEITLCGAQPSKSSV